MRWALAAQGFLVLAGALVYEHGEFLGNRLRGHVFVETGEAGWMLGGQGRARG